MIFVDSNIFIYAVGRPHPLRSQAQSFFVDSRKNGEVLVTSAEVLQELLHAYLPVGRLKRSTLLYNLLKASAKTFSRSIRKAFFMRGS